MDNQWDTILGIRRIRKKLDPAVNTLNAMIFGGAKIFLCWYQYKVIINITVEAMADAGPLLEALERDLGIEFDKTNDSGAGWREVRSTSCSWLRVDIEPDADSAKCKRVVVGYDQLPRYEFQCEE